MKKSIALCLFIIFVITNAVYGVDMKTIGVIKEILTATPHFFKSKHEKALIDVKSAMREAIKNQEKKEKELIPVEKIEEMQFNQNVFGISFSATQNSIPTMVILIFINDSEAKEVIDKSLVFDDMEQYQQALSKYSSSNSTREMVHNMLAEKYHFYLGPLDPEPQQISSVSRSDIQPVAYTP